MSVALPKPKLHHSPDPDAHAGGGSAGTSDVRFSRLRATTTFAGQAHQRWTESRLAVVGVGVLGGLFAREACRSGAHVDLYDMDVGETHNRGNQHVEVGVPKAEAVARLGNAIAPGSARAHVVDIRHVGPGSFENVALIVDCSDDARLALPLTELSNGWGVPLMRLAVDGSGRLELGRILVSHGGDGHACELCSWTWNDVFDPGPRTPCLGARSGLTPTNAGAPLGMTVAGLGLLQAQRLVGGAGSHAILDREVIVDLDAPGILPMRLSRNEECLSGHKRFDPTRLERGAADTTLKELFSLARLALARGGGKVQDVSVAFRGHPILLGVTCSHCGLELVRPGTLWRPTPDCPQCGGAMERRWDVALDHLNRAQARALGLTDTSCETLGLPPKGALVVARAPGRPPVQLLFD
jgi:hypothetical protein